MRKEVLRKVEEAFKQHCDEDYDRFQEARSRGEEYECVHFLEWDSKRGGKITQEMFDKWLATIDVDYFESLAHFDMRGCYLEGSSEIEPCRVYENSELPF